MGGRHFSLNTISGPTTGDCVQDGDANNPPYRGFISGFAVQGSGQFLPKYYKPNTEYTVQVSFKRDDFPVQSSERLYVTVDLPSTATQGYSNHAWASTITVTFNSGETVGTANGTTWGDISISAGHNGDAYYYNTYIDYVTMWEGGEGDCPLCDSDGDGCLNFEDPDPSDPLSKCNCDVDGEPDEDCDGCSDADDGVSCNCETAGGLPDADCDGIADEGDEDDDNDGCPDADDPDPTDPTVVCPCVDETDEDCDGCKNADEGVECDCPGDKDCDGIPDEEDPDPECDQADDADCDGCPDAQDPKAQDPTEGCDGEQCPGDKDCDGIPDEDDPKPDCNSTIDWDCDGCWNSRDREPNNPLVGCDKPPPPCTSTTDVDCDGCPNEQDQDPQNPNVGCKYVCPGDADCDGCQDAYDEAPYNPQIGCVTQPPDDGGGGEEGGSWSFTMSDEDPWTKQWEFEPYEEGYANISGFFASMTNEQIGTQDYVWQADFGETIGVKEIHFQPSLQPGMHANIVSTLNEWRPIYRTVIAVFVWLGCIGGIVRTVILW